MKPRINRLNPAELRRWSFMFVSSSESRWGFASLSRIGTSTGSAWKRTLKALVSYSLTLTRALGNALRNFSIPAGDINVPRRLIDKFLELRLSDSC